MFDLSISGQTRNQKDIMREELEKAQRSIGYLLDYVDRIPELENMHHHELVKEYSEKLRRATTAIIYLND